MNEKWQVNNAPWQFMNEPRRVNNEMSRVGLERLFGPHPACACIKINIDRKMQI